MTRRMRSRYFFIVGLGMALFGAQVQAGVLSPYQAIYEVNRGSIMLGDTTFTLSSDGDHCYKLQGVAEPKGLAALFAGRMTEKSHFCVDNGRIRSQHYSVHKEGGDDDDSYTLQFDWGNKLVTTGASEPRELPAEGLDRGVLELVLRQTLARHIKDPAGELPDDPFIFLMVEDDEITPYRFQVTGRETLTTPIGRFETILVERTNSSRRQFRMWLAPELDYLPVRLERQKKDKEPIRMNIRKLPLSPAAENGN